MEETECITAVLYDPDTGRILASRAGSRQSMGMEDLPHIAGDYDIGINYVDLTQSPPAVTPRPSMAVTQDKQSIAAGGTDAMTLSGLPVPCHVRIGTAGYGVTDGELEWSSLMPAVYEIEVTAFPYLDWRGEVEVV
jgi:hypothetical protein